jgi:UDP-3-O-[3-hydroxymyristoyl] glucosamine N-acyltransferase
MKIKQIAKFLNADFEGDGEFNITNISSLNMAKEGDISFIEKIESFSNNFESKASCLIIPENSPVKLEFNLIRSKNPKLAFAQIAKLLIPPKNKTPKIHSTAIIDSTVTIGKDVSIDAFCFIGRNSKVGDNSHLYAGVKIGDEVNIGNNSILYPNVFIDDNSQIGNNVILNSGVVIGTDGFGYVKDDLENRYIKFPQIGHVVIEDDVEIGANSCVDRGALGITRIGEGTKIDNLVQVAHNVDIGKRVVIAAQTGISGSVTIEDDCVIAGQVGFADHTTIKKGAIIGAKSAVFPGKIVRKGVWSGIPVQPMNDYKKQNAYIRSLPRLVEEIKKIKKIIKNSE